MLFWVHYGLILEPLGLQKHSKFVERVIIFKHFVVFAADASLDQESHQKTSPRDSQILPKGSPEEPRRALERPGAIHGDPQNHPQRAPSAPLGLQEASGSALEGIWASFSSFGGLFFSHFQAISHHHASIIKQQSSLIDHHSSLVNHLNDQHQSSMIIIDHH